MGKSLARACGPGGVGGDAGAGGLLAAAWPRSLSTTPLSAMDWVWVLLFSGWSQVLETLLIRVRRLVLRRISLVHV